MLKKREEKRKNRRNKSGKQEIVKSFVRNGSVYVSVPSNTDKYEFLLMNNDRVYIYLNESTWVGNGKWRNGSIQDVEVILADGKSSSSEIISAAEMEFRKYFL